jgi:biopolymer transport protein ExbD
MPKFKKLKKLPKLDMNPMVDMAFLLVCFFMMTTTFKMDSPFEINLPESHSQIKIPEKDICMITVGKGGEVFIGLNNQFDRREMLEFISQREGIPLSNEQAQLFTRLNSIGSPLEQLNDLLNMKLADIKAFKQPGIPIDSSNNELKKWIMAARVANPRLRFAIEADEDLDYPTVHKLIESLRDLNITRFNLITDELDDSASG